MCNCGIRAVTGNFPIETLRRSPVRDALPFRRAPRDRKGDDIHRVTMRESAGERAYASARRAACANGERAPRSSDRAASN